MNGNDRAIAALESLEARRLLSAELLSGGELLLIGTSGADAIVVGEGAGNGQVEVFGVDGVADGEVFSGVNSLSIVLRAGNDTVEITGSPTDAQGGLLGTSVKGGGGNDTILGGPGVDLLKGNAGDDEIRGGSGNDRLVGGDGNDLLFGGDGVDRLIGNTNTDQLFGEGGADRLVGGSGNDLLSGGAGNDELFGKNGRDDLFGGPGNDELFGLNGRDNLFGEAGDDFLKGNAGRDNVHGGRGNDVIEGGAGPDTLTGGLGNDSITGNGARDNFRAKMFERNDFGEGDWYFSQDAANGEDFAVIDDAMWDAIEDLDDQGLFNTVMWRGVDGAQQILAACGARHEAILVAFGNLSSDEQEAIGEQLDPIDAAFDAAVGDNFQNLTGQRGYDYLNDFTQIDAPQNLRTLLSDYLDCIDDNRTAFNNTMAGFRALGVEGLMTLEFDEALFDDILL